MNSPQAFWSHFLEVWIVDRKLFIEERLSVEAVYVRTWENEKDVWVNVLVQEPSRR